MNKSRVMNAINMCAAISLSIFCWMWYGNYQNSLVLDYNQQVIDENEKIIAENTQVLVRNAERVRWKQLTGDLLSPMEKMRETRPVKPLPHP